MNKNEGLRKDDQESLLKNKFDKRVNSDAELSTETEYYRFVHNSTNSYIQYLGKYEKKRSIAQPVYEAFINTQSSHSDRYYFTDMQNSEISSLNDIYTLKDGQELTENDRAIMKPYVYKADYQRKGGKRATKTCYEEIATCV